MKWSQNHIIIRKNQDVITIWISEKYLREIFGICISEYLYKRGRVNYKKSVHPCHRSKDILPATGKSWRYARLYGQFYYGYGYIPDREGTRYRSRLGDKETLLLAADEAAEREKKSTQKYFLKALEAYVRDQIDNRDMRFYMFHRIDGACKYNPTQATQLAEALAWARSIRKLIDTGGYTEFGVNTQSEFYDLCALILHKKELEGFHITTGGSLRKRMRLFPMDQTEQYNFLIHKNYGNKNAQILGKNKLVNTATGEIYNFDVHQALILDLWMNPGGSSKAYKQELWGEYKTDLKYWDENIEPVSYETLCKYTSSFDVQLKTAKEHHGEKYFNNMYLPYISSKKLEYANSLLCADGSGTVLYKYYDRKGKLRTMNLYIMMISDVATGKIIGWSFSNVGQHSESFEMLRSAMIKALETNNLTEIMEFVSDNHKAFTSNESKQLLNMVCRRVRTIALGNSQANYAETQFRLFKKRLRRLFNWSGSSWGAQNIENIANTQRLNAEDLPSYGEVIKQIEGKIEEWNNTVTRTGVSRSQLYAENIHPEAEKIDATIWRRISGRFSKREISRQRGTIVLESAEQKYKFEIPYYEGLGEVAQSYLGYTNLVEAHIYWDILQALGLPDDATVEDVLSKIKGLTFTDSAEVSLS